MASHGIRSAAVNAARATTPITCLIPGRWEYRACQHLRCQPV